MQNQSDFVDAGALAKLSRRQNRVRVKSDFVSGFNVIWVVQSQTKKYFASVFQKSVSCFGHPTPKEEGRLAIVTNVGVGCGGRDGVVHAKEIAGRVMSL